MPDPAAPVVLLAGVPGAGKSRALRSLARARPEMRIADPDLVRLRLAGLVPTFPYAVCRPVVHTLAHLIVLGQLLRRTDAPLVVHDPGTRTWSRRLFLRVARHRGMRPALVFIDVGRAEALAGQRARGRVVRAAAFERHWRRWTALRARLLRGEELSAGERWPLVRLTEREAAVPEVLALLTPDGAEPDGPASAGHGPAGAPLSPRHRPHAPPNRPSADGAGEGAPPGSRPWWS